MTYGAGASEQPDWVPIYPGTEPQGTFASDTPEMRAGAFSFETDDDLDQVLSFYVSELEAGGFVIQNRDHDSGGRLPRGDDLGRGALGNRYRLGQCRRRRSDGQFHREKVAMGSAERRLFGGDCCKARMSFLTLREKIFERTVELNPRRAQEKVACVEYVKREKSDVVRPLFWPLESHRVVDTVDTVQEQPGVHGKRAFEWQNRWVHASYLV